MSEAILYPFSKDAIDLTDWTLEVLEKDNLRVTKRLILAAASEAIKIAAEQYDATASFHCDKSEEHDGYYVINDLLKIRVMIPLGDGMIGPEWDFSLIEVINEFLEVRTIGNPPQFAEDSVQEALKLRDALLSAVQMINAALPDADDR